MDAIAELEDEAFLSQVAAVEEAFALSTKRRKISTATATAADSSKQSEGAYTAALRGSNSFMFQHHQQSKSNARINKVDVSTNADSGGSCYKCGKSGHWSRDCDSNAFAGAAVDPTVPVKACPCGVGDCNVLTANTEKNRGRKFYKCPFREENGGCGFFEWCDKSLETGSTTLGSHSSLNPSVPELLCPCGAGSCLILTAKTEKNSGRQFYRCPANQGSSCGFFKFCDDHPVTPNFSNTDKTYKVHNTNEMSNKSFGVRSGSSCYKCGKDGHWAKDCVQSSIQPPADFGAKTAAPSGTCYKCGKPGHWAKDCSSGADARARFRQ